MRLKQFLQKGGRKYTDPFYDQTDINASQKVGVPVDVLRAVRLAGEKSNENQISSDGAKGVYQFIPSVRNSVLKKYGVDAWNPDQSSLAAAYLLKEGADRNKGDYTTAVREYHGGLNRENWGSVNKAYIDRVNNFLNNGYSDNSSQNYSYATVDTKVFDDMKKGLWDYKAINEAYSKNPKFTEMMISNIQSQTDREESQKLEQERLQQEENKKIVEQENAQIELALQQREADKQRLLSMVPQSQSVSSGNIKPGFMQKGGLIDIKNFFKNQF